MPIWYPWLGLPHQFAADPRDGKAADCLVMVWAVLEAAKAPYPSWNPQWLEMARTGRWKRLRALWARVTVPLPQPLEHAVFMRQRGVGVVTNGGLLTVHHRRGVCWVPYGALGPVEYRRFAAF